MREWRGCPLVNPLCPNDLCTLPAGHEGSWEGRHRLFTCADITELSDVMYLVPLRERLTAQVLMQLGATRRAELWPEEFAAQ